MRASVFCLALCLALAAWPRLGRTETDLTYAAAVDIQVVAAKQALTPKAVEQQMRELAEAGVKRVYCILCNPGYSMFSSPTGAPYKGSMLLLSHRLLGGKINAAYAAACKQYGLEAIAVIKPYEGGGSMSVPGNISVSASNLNAPAVGGNRVFFDSFTAAHPEMRLERRADQAWERSEEIKGLEAVFILDAFQNAPDGRGVAKTYTPDSLENISARSVYLWMSRDNGEYTRYEGPMTVAWTWESRHIADANGVTFLYGQESDCAVLTLSGLSLPEDCAYLALGFSDAQGMYTIPSSMITLLGAEGQLPTSVTRWARYPRDVGDRPENHVWGMERQPESTTNLAALLPQADGGLLPLARKDCTARAGEFIHWGFEYGWFGQGHSGDGWCSAPVYGVALGKDQYVAGLLCEAYPEVRNYWLSLVETALAEGYAGVDIRLAGHSSMVTDFMNYGYNAPLMEAYQARYGEDISAGVKSAAQYERLMALRGEYFMEFLQAASEYTHAKGGLFSVHLRQAYLSPDTSANWNRLCHWTAPKIFLDWRDAMALCDEITIKDYHYDAYHPALAREIMAAAAEQEKPVWVHCYIQQANNFHQDFLDAVEKDSLVSGVVLYELTASVNDYRQLLSQATRFIAPPAKEE